METPLEASVKVQRIIGALSRMSIQNFNQYGIVREILYFLESFSVMLEMSLLSVFFSGEDHLCFFWQKGNIIFVTYIQKISYFHVFLRKIIFHFPSKEKMSYFREKEIPFF